MKGLTLFFNIEVERVKLESVVDQLVKFDEISTIQEISKKPRLYIYAILNDHDHVERFTRELHKIKGITNISSQLLLRRFKESRIIFLSRDYK